MKNIILQHWTGDMDEVTTLSSVNISKYARKVEADYRLLRGNIFRTHLQPQCQKVYMLDEEFDEYDTVAMIDSDMFVRKGMEENVFNVEGMGMFTEVQRILRKKLTGNTQYPYWGGAIYKFDQKTRQKLRAHINEEEMKKFGKIYVDEGIMHCLAISAKIDESTAYLPGYNKWCHGSFEKNIENAAMIHLRPKYVPKHIPENFKEGTILPKRPKIESYRQLVERGLIE